jgi:hypothetical protein
MRVRTIAVVTCLLVLIGASTAGAEKRHYQFGDNNKLIFVKGESWQPEGFDEAIILTAPLVEKAPAIDGKADDPAWARAKSLTVPLAYGPVKEATLKAVYTEKEVFLLVSWPDATKDDQHHPWVWDAEQGRYVEGPQVEDQLLVSFEAGCEWTPSLLSGYVYDFDGWRWLAARTDPIGQAVDVAGHTHKHSVGGHYFTKYKTRATGPTWQLKFEGFKPSFRTTLWQELERIYRFSPISEDIWVSLSPDGEQPSTSFAERLEAPTYPPESKDAPAGLLRPAHASQPTQILPQFKPVKLTGDAGEVAAKGRWADGRWTVEFRRVLETPARTATDMVFNRVTQFSVYVFDHTERLDEAGESGRLFIQFLPAE